MTAKASFWSHSDMKRLLALGAATLVAATLGARPALAQDFADQGGSKSISVPKDKSAAFRLDYPVGEIVVSAPETLALVATTDRSFYVRGKQIGATNILIYDRAHHLAQVIDARVGYDVATIQSDLASALPGENIRVSDMAGGLVLTGEASTSAAAARAAAIAERYAPKQVQTELRIRSAQQVMVEVRILEVTRTALQDLGFNLSAQSKGSHLVGASGNGLINNAVPQGLLGLTGSIGGVSITATLQALEQKGAVHTLARPNLVAMSGEEASFLAGGEFPFPVPNGTNNGTSIEFRTFGIKLNVIPTVEDSGEIRLKVAPEVSQLDSANGVTLQGFQVPGLDTTRAATSVELRDGQSFAIAGLFSKDTTRSVNQVPGLGEIPVLGALFKSGSWQRNETELVIIVTPHLISPSDNIESLPDPLRGMEEPSIIDLILEGKGFDLAKSPAPATHPVS